MIKSSLIYTLVSLLNKGIPFLLLPFLTTYLSLEDYGILALIQLFISFVFPIQHLNGNLFITKKFSSISIQEKEIYFNSHTMLVVLLTFVFLFISLIIFFLFRDKIEISYYWIIGVVFCGLFNSIYLTYTTLLRCENRPYKYAILEVSKTVLNLLMSLYLVINILQSWESRVISILSTTFVFGILAIFLFYYNKRIEFKCNSMISKEILNFSLPLLPFSVGMIIINLSDRLFIEYYEGVNQLGIYSVAYTIGMLILLIAESFNKAWSPKFFELIIDYSKNKNQIMKVLIIYTIVLLISPIVLGFLAKYLIFPFLINISFHSALQYVVGIAYSYVFYGIYLVLYPFLAWRDQTKSIGKIFTFAAILNLILNYLLIESFGLFGAVYSTLFTYMVMVVLIYLRINRSFKAL